MRLWLDTETYSETPIRAGTYRYAADSEVMLIPWAIDDGPVRVVDLTAGDSANEVCAAAAIADEVWTHNAMFDRATLARFGLRLPVEKWRCSMVQALCHALPGSLDKLCELFRLGADKAKIADGKALIRLFCQPRPKNSKLRRATRETHPEEWARFVEYAIRDVEAMREVQRLMPSWNYPDNRVELGHWHLDQRINDRGFGVDVDLAQRTLAMVKTEQKRLAGEVRAMTDGEVTASTQRDAMLEHIAGIYGLVLDDLKGSTLDRLLADDELPLGLRELLRNRQQASTTSTAKLTSLLKGEVDGRLRGTLQFAGAGRTARWAGRGFQPQNIPSRDLLEPDDIVVGIDAILDGVADLMFDDRMKLAASVLRGCIVPAAGNTLSAADLANIEGRGLSWLAGEEWKLQAFRDFDAGTGPDLYKLAFARSFARLVETVTKGERQVGKVQELALGYEGGVGAFVTFALAYGMDLEQLAADAWDTLPVELRDEAQEFFDWTKREKRPTFGLSRRAFVACDTIKRGWRGAHPATRALWADLKAACLDAIDSNHREFRAGPHLRVRRDGSWMRVILPSGRALCYPQPRVEAGAVTYMGVNQYTRKWQRLKTYGGKLAENTTQAFARDVMAHGMALADEWGFQITMTVHDEVVVEAPAGSNQGHEALCEMITAVPAWAPGLPLAAKGFTATRYGKD